MTTVLLSAKDGYADQWGSQFVAAAKNRRKQVILPKSASPTIVITKMREAVRNAGSHGTIVLNVGHGSSGSTATDGFVDLSDGKQFRLGGLNNRGSDVFVSVFYDMDTDGSGPRTSGLANDEKYNKSSGRMKRWATYQSLCEVFRGSGVYKVVLLTCRVGKSLDFIKKIALDWNVIIEGYKRRIVLTPQSNNRISVHLKGSQPTQQGETQLPSTNSVLVGPPI